MTSIEGAALEDAAQQLSDVADVLRRLRDTLRTHPQRRTHGHTVSVLLSEADRVLGELEVPIHPRGDEG